jgi:hypothetical protein
MKAPISIEDAQAKLNYINALSNSGRVEVDDLGNTIPASEYKREQASFLAEDIRRIAWSPHAHAEAMTIARQADTIARR